MIDAERVKRLIHGPQSPTYVDELERRIDSYNRYRVRQMDYLIARIREAGSLNQSTYDLFRRELKKINFK